MVEGSQGNVAPGESKDDPTEEPAAPKVEANSAGSVMN